MGLIKTETDTQVEIQEAEVIATRANGITERVKRVVIILSTEIGTDADGEQVAILDSEGIDEAIEQLTALKEIVKE